MIKEIIDYISFVLFFILMYFGFYYAEALNKAIILLKGGSL